MRNYKENYLSYKYYYFTLKNNKAKITDFPFDNIF